jgi:hypothetical protein
MSKFIDVISTKGEKYSINVSQIIYVEEDNPKKATIHFTPAKDFFCVSVNISYDDVMKLIRE